MGSVSPPSFLQCAACTLSALTPCMLTGSTAWRTLTPPCVFHQALSSILCGRPTITLWKLAPWRTLTPAPDLLTPRLMRDPLHGLFLRQRVPTTLFVVSRLIVPMETRKLPLPLEPVKHTELFSFVFFVHPLHFVK